MDDKGEEAPAASKRRKKSPYMPHEIVWEILTRLPVESLLRFSCVCKAWRSTILGDTSFQRTHLRLQKPFLLVSPHTVEDRTLTHIDKIGLYRLDDDNQQGATVPLVYATDDVSSDESMDGFAHCDGLVLLPGKATVRVLNPATRRALTLPRNSPGADAPRLGPGIILPMHQALGLGHDPRSNAYKVARFYYRSMWHRSPVTGGSDYTIATEVFTIGTDVHWRETTAQPPYPIIAGVTATFFKGFLLCFINERALGDAAPGLLRFRLEDEAFGVMPQPPCCPRMQHAKPVLAELRGELCLACGSTDKKTIRMWMCDNVENPRWDQPPTPSTAAERAVNPQKKKRQRGQFGPPPRHFAVSESLPPERSSPPAPCTRPPPSAPDKAGVYAAEKELVVSSPIPSLLPNEASAPAADLVVSPPTSSLHPRRICRRPLSPRDTTTAARFHNFAC
uniref:Uncharacterized protein n=1 Tax=Avena sativa TaxID=4498 RepID=A0ACD5XCK3_AVESA